MERNKRYFSVIKSLIKYISAHSENEFNLNICTAAGYNVNLNYILLYIEIQEYY